MTYLVPRGPLPDVVLDLDDFRPDYKANALSELSYLKWKYPNLKVTLFTIPFWNDEEYIDWLEMVSQNDWIELALHGFRHDANECETWTYNQTRRTLEMFEGLDIFAKVFKAPNWKCNPDVYQAIKDCNWICADLEDNKDNWIEGLKVYSTAHPYCVHGHTWDLNNPQPEYNNGIRQIIERGVPWNEKSEFKFITDLFKEDGIQK